METLIHSEDILLCAQSLSQRTWWMRGCDERQALAMAQRHGLPDLLARLLAARGLVCDEAESFLNPSLKALLPDPSAFKDMELAAERIAAAIVQGEKVAVFGDYDVDGATSSALLLRYFRMLGQEALLHIPDRIAEGYGPNAPALLALKNKGASLVITVDCGTLAHEPLAAAFEAGLDAIVLDHHLSASHLPKAYAVVNPNRLDETTPHRQLAAVGVTFLALVATNRKLRAMGYFAHKPEPSLLSLLDLVALGTVCDVVPLTGVNRALVCQGIKVLANRSNTGISALMDVSRVDERPGVYHLGFILGPRVNAGGRVGKADMGARLLATDDPAEAKALAEALDRFNHERKTLESIALEEAVAQAEAQAAAKRMLMVHADHWHPGIIGIVAGRLKERYHLPTAAITFMHGMGKASARSISGFDLGAAVIAACDAGILAAGGGHAMAAGFSVEKPRLDALAGHFESRLARHAESLSAARKLMIDLNVSVSGLTVELAHALERAGPYGASHPQPRLMVEHATIIQAEAVGADGSHLRLLLADHFGSGGRVQAMAFRAGGTPFGEAILSMRGKKVRAAGTLKAQSWMGKERVTLNVEDMAAE